MGRGSLAVGIAIVAVAGGIAGDRPAAGDAEGAVSPGWRFEEARQFDFWLGSWEVNLRMLQEDLTWEDRVAARVRIYSVLDGKAVLELWDSEPIKGFSIRYYDPARDAWVLWLNWPGQDRSGGSALEGRFRHGRGEFMRNFTSAAGEEGIARYTFSDIGRDRLRWDDAYSTDGGKTWASNWIMEFRRSGPPVPLPLGEENLHTYDDGSRCTLDPFRRFERLVGSWSGTVEERRPDESPASRPATLTAHRILDGCAVLAFLTSGDGVNPYRDVRLLTWNTGAGRFEEDRLDNRGATGLRVLRGSGDGDTVRLETEEGDRRTVWSLPETDRLTLEELSSADGETWVLRRRAELRRQ